MLLLNSEPWLTCRWDFKDSYVAEEFCTCLSQNCESSVYYLWANRGLDLSIKQRRVIEWETSGEQFIQFRIFRVIVSVRRTIKDWSSSEASVTTLRTHLPSSSTPWSKLSHLYRNSSFHWLSGLWWPHFHVLGSHLCSAIGAWDWFVYTWCRCEIWVWA